MKTNEQVIDELTAERDEVLIRFNKLDDFIDTKQYSELPVRHQRLIQKQWIGMDKYVEALGLRISDLEVSR